ncbi:MAG: hypothetical protein KDD92_15665 [Caldilineaceae bacterium]|nr:hypothetical protein [Caldilineaceae bacterium]
MTKRMIQPHLFTVRIWLEESDRDQFDCRGHLQHGVDGSVRHFQGWSALIDLITEALHEASRASSGVTGAMRQASPPEIEAEPSQFDID